MARAKGKHIARPPIAKELQVQKKGRFIYEQNFKDFGDCLWTSLQLSLEKLIKISILHKNIFLG